MVVFTLLNHLSHGHTGLRPHKTTVKFQCSRTIAGGGGGESCVIMRHNTASQSRRSHGGGGGVNLTMFYQFLVMFKNFLRYSLLWYILRWPCEGVRRHTISKLVIRYVCYGRATASYDLIGDRTTSHDPDGSSYDIIEVARPYITQCYLITTQS